MEKKFIRFVCNTVDHIMGEKIKALSIITKVYDNENNFIKVKKPYIHALENQIEIDIEGFDYKQYLPLHHFKHDKGSIVKKSAEEIDSIEVSIAQAKADRQALIQQKQQETADAKLIVSDESKTDSEKLAAIIDVLKKEGIL